MSILPASATPNPTPLTASTVTPEPLAATAVTPKVHLEALTSLRFIAAACVIAHHVSVVFLKVPPNNLSFAQAVSFFFVLSGFILTYVHPSLPTKQDVLSFWRARFARIYPAHFTGLMLACWLVPQCNPLLHMREFLANLFLVHSWIPIWPYFFGYNSSSWSVSTELFFYLVFPVLVYRIKETWVPKLALSLACVLGLAAITYAFHIPGNGFHVSTFSLLYVFPPGRLFEFALGMSCFLAWKKLSAKQFDRTVCTALEVLTMALAAGYMIVSGPVTAWMQTIPALEAPAVWLLYSGNCFFFAATIIVFGLNRGAVSKFLSHKVLVWLGELSYAIYILHFPYMIWVLDNMKRFGLSPEMASFMFCSTLLVISHVFFTYIEKPLRALIIGKRSKPPVAAATAVVETTMKAAPTMPAS